MAAGPVCGERQSSVEGIRRDFAGGRETGLNLPMTTEIRANGQLSIELRSGDEIERLALRKMLAGFEKGQPVRLSRGASVGDEEAIVISMERD